METETINLIFMIILFIIFFACIVSCTNDKYDKKIELKRNNEEQNKN